MVSTAIEIDTDQGTRRARSAPALRGGGVGVGRPRTARSGERAIPFEAVVPAFAAIDTEGREGAGCGAWGWLVAGHRSLDVDRLRAARFHVEVEDRRIRAGMRLLNLPYWAPLRPREVAGALDAQRAQYTPRLARSERFRDSLIEAWGLTLDFPEGLSLATWLRFELELGGERLRGETRLSLGPAEADVVVREVQRVRSTPVPTARHCGPRLDPFLTVPSGPAALVSSAP